MTPRDVDLSIDFDFFVREELAWDWGHSEDALRGALGDVIWHTRYGVLDVYAETDPLRHADVPPWRFVRVLETLGMDFSAMTEIGVADSHEHALKHLEPRRFKGREAVPLLLHFDAHHDCYGGPGRPEWLSCENWVQHYLAATQAATQVQWIQPRFARAWGTPQLHPDYHSATHQPAVASWHGLTRGAYGPLTQLRVRRVFLCLSSGWTPPHLDLAFLELVRDFAERVQASARAAKVPVVTYDTLRKRGFPSRAEAEELRATFAAQMAELGELNRRARADHTP